MRQKIVVQTKDFAKATQAFVEKRKPQFIGD